MPESGFTVDAAVASTVAPPRAGWWSAAVAAGLLGAGGALWWASVSTWRAVSVGVPLLPFDERVLTAFTCAIGAGIGVAWQARRRSFMALAAALIGAVVLAAMAVATMSPRTASTTFAAVPLLALPLASAAALLAAMVGGRASGGATLLAGAGLGAAASLSILSVFAVPEWAPVFATGAVLWLAAATLAPRAVVASSRVAARAMPSLALPAGAVLVWFVCIPAGLGEQSMAWPGADCSAGAFAAAALGFGMAARLPLATLARANGLATVVLAAFAAAAASDPLSRTTGIAVASAFLLANAMGSGSPRELLAAGGRALAGAILGVAGCQIGLSIGVVAAVLAVGASLALVRRTALGGISTIAGGFAVVVFGGATSSSSATEDVVLGRSGTARASWSARTQQITLAIDGLEVDRAGPSCDHATLLMFAAMALAPDRGTIAVLGPHTGRLRACARDFQLDAVAWIEPCADAIALQPRLQADGPVAPAPGVLQPNLAGAAPALLGSRTFLLHVPLGSCAAVIDGTLLGAALPGRATVAEHAAMRRAATNGAVLQAIALDTAPPDLLLSALASAAVVHPWCGVFLFERTLLLCGLARPPEWDRIAEVLDGLPIAARWHLHSAGLGSVGDLRSALLAELAPPLVAPSEATPLPAVRSASGSPNATLDANAAALASVVRSKLDATGRARLQALTADIGAWALAEPVLAKALRERPLSVLLRREVLAIAVRIAERSIAAADPANPAQVADASVLAARFFHLGSPSPILQAALALPDRKDQRVRERRNAGRAALALDAGFAADAPPLLRPVLAGLQAHSPLADWTELPPAERLAELAVGDGPLAIALRHRFRSRSAAALVAQWGASASPPAALAALRELADPFVIEAAAVALRGRGAEAELLRIWRADLPATASILAFADGPAAQRQALQVALGGRTDRASLMLLGRGLVDEDRAVRTAAGAALFRSIGERIVYDPEWPVDRLRDAAAQLAEHSQLQRTPR